MCRIQGFPTIKAAVKGKLQEYQGDRSATSLRDFALGLLSNKAVKTLNKPAQVNSTTVHTFFCRYSSLRSAIS